MWLTIPNALTFTRLATVPVIVALLWPGIESRQNCFWAMVIYIVGGLTDIIDGVIARRLNQVTVLGKFLDPLSDKIVYLVTLIALLQLPGPRVPPWLVMFIVIREVSITGLRAIAASEGIVIDAKDGGKLKTVFATVGMCGLLMHYPYLINFGFTQVMVNMHVAGLWVTFISAAFALTSGVGYVRGFVHATKKTTAAT